MNETELLPTNAIGAEETVEIRVHGTVQGVGFRPTVWRLARDIGLRGEVLNDSSGVLIRTTGAEVAISQFVKRLRAEAPPLAHIETVNTRRLATVLNFADFQITESEFGENRTRVTPDASVCNACEQEVLSPEDRRYQYPFANCTHCGPRFSIVKRVPYDRGHTTMAEFPMCQACAAEYGDPNDRRFHAQPIACPECGPQVWLEPLTGDVTLPQSLDSRPTKTDAIDAAIQWLKQGQIIAIRGLGGFHLACDATNSGAVDTLRNRKHRYGKPFALMARDVAVIARYCSVTSVQKELLESAEAPIVLLQTKRSELLPRGIEPLPAGLAPGLSELGFMLPYTPLHLLIMRHIDLPLVMTSGNVTDEPQVTSIDAARTKLSGIADALLMHNRDIANRIDDSVVRVMAGKPRLIRRARGYAPSAIALPKGFADAADLLAFGGELKSTFCLLKDGAAVLSQHQGDLEDLATLEDYQKNLQLYTEMYDHRPQSLAADSHPEYLSTKLAKEKAAADQLPLDDIQHHHAHIASCLAENGVELSAAPVLGIALDGLGFGDDGSIWGGEFMVADYRGYQRVATFKPVAMLGGAQAIRQPWRSTYAHLVAAMGWQRFADQYASLDLCRYLDSKPLQTIDRMFERGINVPLATSCGRLFDAVAAAIGLCRDRAMFEGQGAMQLEAAAERHATDPAARQRAYRFCIVDDDASELRIIDPTEMWLALLSDLGKQTPVEVMAARFQQGLATAISQLALTICRSEQGLCKSSGSGSRIERVALSGGCFQNRFLLEEVVRLIEAGGLRCLLHAKVPANDGGLALGQAAIAAARQIEHSKIADYSRLDPNKFQRE